MEEELEKLLEIAPKKLLRCFALASRIRESTEMPGCRIDARKMKIELRAVIESVLEVQEKFKEARK
jgi:hypothetical protein